MVLLKDKKLIILAVILAVFTVGYFIIANKISYAFVADYDAKELYNSTLEAIKQSAIAYGKANLDQIQKSESHTIYPKVQDLVDSGLLVPNENGLIVNPLKTNESLNNNMIKIKYEKEEFFVEIDN